MNSDNYMIPGTKPRRPWLHARRTTNQTFANSTTAANVLFQDPPKEDTELAFSVPNFLVPEPGLWFTHLSGRWTVSQFNGQRLMELFGVRSSNPGVLEQPFIMVADQKGPRTVGLAAGIGHSMLSADHLLPGDQINARAFQTNDGVANQDLTAENESSPVLRAYRFAQPDRYVGVRVTSKVNQSIPNVTVTEVDLNGRIEYDRGFQYPGGNFIPIREAGFYLVIAQVVWAGQSSGWRGLALRQTSALGVVSVPAYQRYYPGDTGACYEQIVWVVRGDPGDRLSLAVDQSSGGAALNILFSESSRMPNIRVYKLDHRAATKFGLAEAQLPFMLAYNKDSPVYGVSASVQDMYYTDILEDIGSIANNIAAPVPVAGSLHPKRFAIRLRGIYLICANMAYTAGAAISGLIASINVNGVPVSAMASVPEQNQDHNINVVAMAELWPGDYVNVGLIAPSVGRTFLAASPTALYKNSLVIVGLDTAMRGSVRYFEAGA